MKFFNIVVAVVLIVILSTQHISAATVILGVGESFEVQVDDGVGYSYIGIESVSCNNPSVYVEKTGLTVKATVKAYFSGEATVTSTIRYKLYPSQPNQYRYHKFTVECRHSGGGSGGGTSDPYIDIVSELELNIGDSYTLYVLGGSSNRFEDVKWTLSNEDVVKTDTNHGSKIYITALKEGSTILTAHSFDGAVKSCTINVNPWEKGDVVQCRSDEGHICSGTILDTVEKTWKLESFIKLSDNPSITIPQYCHGFELTLIGGGIGRTSEFNNIIIPSSVKEIFNAAFSGNEYLEKIDMSQNSNIEMIGYKTFSDCPNLKTVLLPSQLQTIYIDAFSGCNIEEITFPATLKSISVSSFFNNPLKRILCEMRNPQEFLYAFDIQVYDEAVLYVPIGTKNLYLAADGWKNFKNIEETADAAITEIVNDDTVYPIEVFNLNGVKISDCIENLPTGILFVRQGSLTKKIVIR